MDGLDRELIGAAHPADHAYLRREGRTGFLVRERGTGRVHGYVYGSGAGRLGPVAALDPALHPALLGVAVRETPMPGTVAMWVPGTADRAMRALLEAGLRLRRLPGPDLLVAPGPPVRALRPDLARAGLSTHATRRLAGDAAGGVFARGPGSVDHRRRARAPLAASARRSRSRRSTGRIGLPMLASGERGSLDCALGRSRHRDPHTSERMTATQGPTPSASPTPPSLIERLTGRARPVETDHAVVVLHDVTKRYPNGKEALKDVDLVVPEGDFVFLVGPSGAGKSTLMKLLIRDELATHGDVVIDGYDLARIKRRQVPRIRRKIGTVFQDFKLLPRKSVWENVAFALEVTGTPRRQIRPAVDRVLALVGLTDAADQIPTQLSGGEQQRTAIARALVHDPRIIIADEPTGNLDPVISWEIIQLLLRINELGVTILMATHQAEVVTALRKRVVALEDGRIIRDETGATYHRED